MAGHGKRRHLKRIAAPKAVPLSKKTTVWFKKGKPGAHALAQSIPLLSLLRDVLKIAGSKWEAKKIIAAGDVLVDETHVSDEGCAVGLMDAVSIPKMKKHYRVVFRKGRLGLSEITAEEAKEKPCKIVGKTVVAGNKVQLNLHDGRNYLIEKEEDQFKAGDTVRLALPSQKLAGFMKLEKGARCYVYKGKHSGKTGVLKEIVEFPYGTPSDVVLEDETGNKLITLKDYLFVVDKNFKA
ncbi:MAG: 30S ribosomal protein S4e [Candidatus Micrarchaeota archaeon]